MHRRLFLIVGMALLSGCASTPTVTPGRPLAELENLYSIDAGREALTLRVASNGCTKKEDFAFYVERKGESVSIAFARKRLDPCRAFVMEGTTVSFSYDELGVDGRSPIFLLNPLVAWAGPGS